MKKYLFSLMLALTATFAFVACDKDDETPVDQPKNIVELAQSNPDLSILVDAVVHADLASTLSGGTFTVFAPTNTAFNSFLQSLGAAKITDVDKNVVRSLLLYHTVPAEVTSQAIQTGYVKSASPFGTTTSNLSLYVVKDNSGVTINNSAKVVTADVDATNGVVHVVDKVIAFPTIVNHALNNPNFSTLVAALTRSDLGVDYVGLLSTQVGASGSSAPFTVFAPTNDAFAALLTEFNFANLEAIPAATLNKVLQYHVVAGANVVSSSLTNNQEVTTFETGKLTVDLSGAPTLVDENGRRARIIATDVQGNNGIIHAIDKVVMPN
jgi:uncharacterized surface protein with fasciclin (FAS1) repeats